MLPTNQAKAPVTAANNEKIVIAVAATIFKFRLFVIPIKKSQLSFKAAGYLYSNEDPIVLRRHIAVVLLFARLYNKFKYTYTQYFLKKI